MKEDRLLEEKLKKLEEDIDKYCGDWGTLEHRLEDTLWLILDILKDLKGEYKE